MAGYSGVDFIDFDSQLNDEEKLVRQTARQFVENEVIPIIEQHSREATFPHHLVPQLGELGFFGANLQGDRKSVVSSDLNGAAIRRKRSYSHHRKTQPGSHISAPPGAAIRRAWFFWRELAGRSEERRVFRSKRGGNSAKTKLFPSSKNTAGKPHFRTPWCRN